MPIAPTTLRAPSSASTPPGTGTKRPPETAASAPWKAGRLPQPVADGPAGNPHAQRAPCLAERDVEAQHAAAVLALERHEMTARIEHCHGERQQIRRARSLQRAIDHAFGLEQREARLDVQT